MDKEMIGMCGAYCGVCEWKDKTNCAGCQKSKGQMFWGECVVAKCAIEKEYTHCGSCSKLPCDNLQSGFDDPDHGDNGERLENLKNWENGNNTFIHLTPKSKS